MVLLVPSPTLILDNPINQLLVATVASHWPAIQHSVDMTLAAFSGYDERDSEATPGPLPSTLVLLLVSLELIPSSADINNLPCILDNRMMFSLRHADCPP
jgi:hypothetical protein